MKIESISKYLRGFAITGVVVENYFSFIPVNSSSSLVSSIIIYVSFLGASFVHIFFFLSGYGLARKYSDSESFNWKKYAINRFSMIAIPYWIVVITTYLFINILHGQNPKIFEASHSLSDLLSNIVFLRNFYESARELNPTLWFIPVVVGLYMAFPFLLYLMKKHGLKALLLISALIAYSSRFVYWTYGYEPARESSIFLFYIFEFAVGMAFAGIPDSKQISLRIGSINIIYFLVTILGYAISYILKMRIGIGANLHEVFTYAGSVALGILSYQLVAYLKLGILEKSLHSIGSVAFILYLIHAPPIQHVIRPILEKYYNNSQGIITVFSILIAYFALITLVSKALAKYSKALSINIERNMKTRFGLMPVQHHSIKEI